MGRPRRVPNHPPPQLRFARFERMRAGLSLFAVAVRTGIPIEYLSKFERGEIVLDEADLVALARVYGCADPSVLAREAIVVAGAAS